MKICIEEEISLTGISRGSHVDSLLWKYTFLLTEQGFMWCLVHFCFIARKMKKVAHFITGRKETCINCKFMPGSITCVSTSWNFILCHTNWYTCTILCSVNVCDIFQHTVMFPNALFDGKEQDIICSQMHCLMVNSKVWPDFTIYFICGYL